jgi:hypothetical protein
VGAREGAEGASGFGPAAFTGARLASVLREFEAAGLGAAVAIAGMIVAVLRADATLGLPLVPA